jgi:hypothetical protein
VFCIAAAPIENPNRWDQLFSSVGAYRPRTKGFCTQAFVVASISASFDSYHKDFFPALRQLQDLHYDGKEAASGTVSPLAGTLGSVWRFATISLHFYCARSSLPLTPLLPGRSCPHCGESVRAFSKPYQSFSPPLPCALSWPRFSHASHYLAMNVLPRGRGPMLAWPDGTGAFVLSYGLHPRCQDVVGIGAMAGICQLRRFLGKTVSSNRNRQFFRLSKVKSLLHIPCFSPR